MFLSSLDKPVHVWLHGDRRLRRVSFSVSTVHRISFYYPRCGIEAPPIRPGSCGLPECLNVEQQRATWFQLAEVWLTTFSEQFFHFNEGRVVLELLWLRLGCR